MHDNQEVRDKIALNIRKNNKEYLKELDEPSNEIEEILFNKVKSNISKR